jgi:Cof subfamily protein (haloacid dehalogenase superfamily)
VATDLDGTLLRSDGLVSERTRDALASVEAAGIDVVLVTARPPRWLGHVAHLVGGHGIVIAGNGAFLYDVRAQAVIRQEPLERILVDELVRELREAVPGVVFAGERHCGAVMDPGYAAPRPEGVSADALVVAMEQRDDVPIGKLLAAAGHEDPEVFLARVVEIVGERAQIAFSGATGLAEITAPGVTKAAALVRWTAEREIVPEQVWAFGDMPNDLPMLRWAGRSFAVANAHPQVLAEADTVCRSNDEDGVAEVLEALVSGLSG